MTCNNGAYADVVVIVLVVVVIMITIVVVVIYCKDVHYFP